MRFFSNRHIFALYTFQITYLLISFENNLNSTLANNYWYSLNYNYKRVQTLNTAKNWVQFKSILYCTWLYSGKIYLVYLLWLNEDTLWDLLKGYWMVKLNLLHLFHWLVLRHFSILPNQLLVFTSHVSPLII